MQETQATLLQEVVDDIQSYSSIQRMIQRKRNLIPIQDGPDGCSRKGPPSLKSLTLILQ